jgi:uncharacterized protein YkwD
MVRQHFFDHTSPSGSTMVSRIKASAYLHGVVSWRLGENLAWGTGSMATPRATLQAWMQSADHRANLLNRSLADVGTASPTAPPRRSATGSPAART